ncbi:MAG: NHL repeat-containing protein [Chthoniobacterales bacterium]
MRRRLLATVFLAVAATAAAREIPNFPPASVILGQPSGTSDTAVFPPTTRSLANPSGVAIDPQTGRVFVADTTHHRVVRYANFAALTTGAPATFAFGQTDLTTAVTGTSASRLNAPTGIWLDASGRLWVADSGNHRVLMFRSAASRVDAAPAADLVLGQPSFGPANSATSVSGMSSPSGLTVDATDRLWVADTGNNRVLEFESASALTSGAPATGVIGQSTFDDADPRSDQLGLSDPLGVAVDSARTLWVADSGNHRVLGYPSAGTVSNGTNAARVIGQPDFNVTTAGTSASRLTAPSGLFADQKQNLWVIDGGNHRALRFAGLASLNNGAPASSLIGQPDFASTATRLSPFHLDHPGIGIVIDPSLDVWLADTGSNRVLKFANVDSEIPTIQARGRKKVKTRRRRLTLRGTASDDTAVTQVLIKVRGQRGLRVATGTNSWNKRIRLKGRSRRIVAKAFAFDAVGNRSRAARKIFVRRR